MQRPTCVAPSAHKSGRLACLSRPTSSSLGKSFEPKRNNWVLDTLLEEEGKISGKSKSSCLVNEPPSCASSQCLLQVWTFSNNTRVSPPKVGAFGSTPPRLFSCLSQIGVGRKERLLAGWRETTSTDKLGDVYTCCSCCAVVVISFRLWVLWRRTQANKPLATHFCFVVTAKNASQSCQLLKAAATFFDSAFTAPLYGQEGRRN